MLHKINPFVIIYFHLLIHSLPTLPNLSVFINMGCASSKEDLTPEEVALINGELRLQYQQYSVNDVDLVSRKYSKGGQINSNQWKDISNKLKISIYSEPVPPEIQGLYDSLKLDNSYSLKDLLVIGVYFSSGTSQDKARLLFEAYDESDDKILNKGELQKLAGFIVELAVEKTSKLVVEEDPNKFSKDNLARFLQDLRAVKNKGKQELLKVFMGGDLALQSVSIDKFVENLTTPSTLQLLTMQGIRKFLKKQKVTQQKFAGLTGLKKPAGSEASKVELPKNGTVVNET